LTVVKKRGRGKGGKEGQREKVRVGGTKRDRVGERDKER
jgi:hypothetical protein